jgi:SAM-dependent methyltransferase
MRSLAEVLRARYERLKSAYLGDRAAAVPPRYRSQFVCYPGASEIQHILDRAVPSSARRVLVIGVFAGRDYFFFKTRGTHEVFAIDLEHVPDFENLRVTNVEDPLPFAQKYFDCVVINEVIEHLVDDAKALGNIRDCLKDDGILFASVPFLHEAEPTHVRVHTRTSVERLFGCCGFEPVEIIERPGLGFYVPWVNEANFAVSLVTQAVLGRTSYGWTLPLLARLERWSGAYPNPVRRLSAYHGGYFVFRKGPKTNYLERNREDFCNVPSLEHDVSASGDGHLSREKAQAR